MEVIVDDVLVHGNAGGGSRLSQVLLDGKVLCARRTEQTPLHYRPTGWASRSSSRLIGSHLSHEPSSECCVRTPPRPKPPRHRSAETFDPKLHPYWTEYSSPPPLTHKPPKPAGPCAALFQRHPRRPSAAPPTPPSATPPQSTAPRAPTASSPHSRPPTRPSAAGSPCSGPAT